MVLPIVKYGHPVLRKKGMRIERITPQINQLIDDMFDTMYAEHGIGLAAQQVGQAILLTVLDVREVTDRPSTMEIKGEPVDVNSFMPMVLINPEVNLNQIRAIGPEGCLSFPEIFADIGRPEFIDVLAHNERMEPLKFRCGGLLAKAIQHELDHLHGILFIDRMTIEDKLRLKPQLESLRAATKATLEMLR